MMHFGFDRVPCTVALDSPRGGISLETERTVTGMSSKLLLTRATVQDGGNDPFLAIFLLVSSLLFIFLFGSGQLGVSFRVIAASAFYS